MIAVAWCMNVVCVYKCYECACIVVVYSVYGASRLPRRCFRLCHSWHCHSVTLCIVVCIQCTERAVHLGSVFVSVTRDTVTLCIVVCIQCTVRAVHPGGVSVSVTRQIHGFIPRIHLAEVLLKNPEKKFIPGKKLKCKVAGCCQSKLWLRSPLHLMCSICSDG